MEKNKSYSKKTEYKSIQIKILFEFYKKVMKVILPVEYNVFASKFIKFSDISESENNNQIIQRIIQNQEM